MTESLDSNSQSPIMPQQVATIVADAAPMLTKFEEQVTHLWQQNQRTAEAAREDKQVHAAIEEVKQNLVKIMEKHGVNPADAAGKTFLNETVESYDYNNGMQAGLQKKSRGRE